MQIGTKGEKSRLFISLKAASKCGRKYDKSFNSSRFVTFKSDGILKLFYVKIKFIYLVVLWLIAFIFQENLCIGLLRCRRKL